MTTLLFGIICQLFLFQHILAFFGDMPTSYTVEEGGTAVLKCLVIDYGTKPVMWRRANSTHPLSFGLFKFSDDPRLTINTDRYAVNRSLVIANVTQEDEGIYECAMSTSGGIYAFGMELKVEAPKTEEEKGAFLPMPRVSMVVVSRPAVVQCEVRNQDAGDVLWTKDGVALSYGTHRISDDPRLLAQKSFNTWSLAIMSSKTSDAGTYSCHLGLEEPFDVYLEVVP